MAKCPATKGSEDLNLTEYLCFKLNCIYLMTDFSFTGLNKLKSKFQLGVLDQ